MDGYVARTIERDAGCDLIIFAPDGTQMFRGTLRDEAEAEERAHVWFSGNLAECCMLGDPPTVRATLRLCAVPVGQFEIRRRPDNQCRVKGPGRSIATLLLQRKAHLCPRLFDVDVNTDADADG